jgi:hypothetical protein
MPALNYLSSDRLTILGHYSLTQKSGILTASTTAGSHLASYRWAPANNSIFAVLLRVKISIVQNTALGATLLDFSGTVARNFTVDYSANNTQANMAGQTAMVRSNMMTPSQMGTKGPQICTTAGMTGQTSLLDTDFMHATPVTNTATAGAAVSATLYDRALEGQHPLEFAGSSPCGYVIRNIAVAPTGTFSLYVTWEWAEVFQSAV